MKPALKAEIRKIFSVRTTYYFLGVSLIAVIFIAFYIEGVHLGPKDLLNRSLLSQDVTGAINALSIFPALIALLLVTHEYRYNVIMYTLTASKNRTTVLLAKVLVISGLAVLFALVFGALSPLLSILGVHANHLKLIHQTFYYRNLLWRSVFFCWGYAMAGLVVGSLVRNQVGAIITLLIAPDTVEGILGLLLKKNVVYLPFSALHQVIGEGVNFNNTITPERGALVFTGYLVVSLAAALYLFLHRDAN